MKVLDPGGIAPGDPVIVKDSVQWFSGFYYIGKTRSNKFAVENEQGYITTWEHCQQPKKKFMRNADMMNAFLEYGYIPTSDGLILFDGIGNPIDSFGYAIFDLCGELAAAESPLYPYWILEDVATPFDIK